MSMERRQKERGPETVEERGSSSRDVSRIGLAMLGMALVPRCLGMGQGIRPNSSSSRHYFRDQLG
jgi:hypothetical protein